MYLGEGVALCNAKDFAIDGQAHGSVEIFPQVSVAGRVLGQALAAHKLALGQSAIDDLRLQNGHCVVFQVVKDLWSRHEQWK